MHHQHHQYQPLVDEPSTDQRLQQITARVRKITTLSAWAEQWATKMSTLRAELAAVRAELAVARQELAYWRRSKAREAGLELAEMPPAHFLAAVRTPQTEDYRPVLVTIDGEDWVVGLKRDRPTDVDPLRELRDWGELVATVREVRAQMREEKG